jgi:solute carrier family 25 thiamine pyrophosphate transporter 19
LAHNTKSPIYKGTLPTLLRIARDEGVAALWKGNIPAEALYVSYSAIQFTTYRFTTKFLHTAFPSPTSPNTSWLPAKAEAFISGATAGAVSTTATYPLDLLRTRFAAQGSEKVYASLRASITDIYVREGPTGFFRGVSAGIAQIVPYMGIFFCGYETLRPVLHPLSLPFGSGDAVAGVISSVIAKTMVFPLDLVRKRLQVQGPTRVLYVHKNIPEYKGVLRTIKMILQREGIRGLYRGLVVSLFKAAPASAVTMWTYERAIRYLKLLDEERDKLS